MATGKDSVMEISTSKKDGDYTEGDTGNEKRGSGKHTEILNDRAKPRSGQKMKESGGDPSEKVWREKKKKGGEVEKRSDREKREGEKETGGGGREFVSGRHFLSRGADEKEIMEGRIVGMKG